MKQSQIFSTMSFLTLVILLASIYSVTDGKFEQVVGPSGPLPDLDLSELRLTHRGRREQIVEPGPEATPSPGASHPPLPADVLQNMRRGTTQYLGSRYALGLLSPAELCRIRETNVTLASGDLDNIELLLNMINVSYTTLDANSTEQQVHSALSKQSCRVALITAGAHVINSERAPNVAALATKLLKRLLKAGGTLVTTDGAAGLHDTAPFPLGDWRLRHKATKADSVRLEIAPPNRTALQHPSTCLGDRKMVTIVDNLTQLLSRFQASTDWHLLDTSSTVRLKLIKGGNQRLYSLVRTEDLPSKWESILTCGDTGKNKGSYWHVTGPLAQFIERGPWQRLGGERKFDSLMLHLFTNMAGNNMYLTEEEKTNIRNTMALLDQAGYPILIKDVATAVVSSTWLTRFILQAWRDDCPISENCLAKCTTGVEEDGSCTPPAHKTEVPDTITELFTMLPNGLEATVPTLAPAVEDPEVPGA